MNDELVELQLDATGQRLDRALADALSDLSRVQIQRLIKEGRVLVNGGKPKASLRIDTESFATVRIPAVVESELLAEQIPLSIQFEDEDLLVVDKPAGMVVHPAYGHESGTLVNAILGHCPDLPGIGGEKRPGIVHRLDKDTSGVIIVAKNDNALRHLQDQFKERTVKKQYIALVEGHPDPDSANINAPIGRDPRQRKKMTVIRPGGSAKAREAITYYETLAYYPSTSLVACFPHTGRTHQIRVHMRFIGHPLVGDRVYGRRKQQFTLPRHFLHAAEITFQLPSNNETVTISAPLAAELQALLDEIGPTVG